MDNTGDKGYVEIASRRSVADTFARLDEVVQTRGMTVFARIDFSGDAERAGLQMPPARLLLFGNPKAGTPLMLAAPTSALDLPLKILVRQDTQGKVWISYNTPGYLQQRHRIPADLLKNIAGVAALVASVAAEPDHS
jgi:uncharacterized protein (DUF302 family)